MKNLNKKPKLLDDLNRIESLETEDLQDLFELYFGENAPKYYRKKQLVDELAYMIQSKIYGGLSKETKNKIKKLMMGKSQTLKPKISINEGVKLVRNWNGIKYTITVVNGGFEYKGQVYKSLSKIAYEITGTKWSGPVFFGLKKRKLSHER